MKPRKPSPAGRYYPRGTTLGSAAVAVTMLTGLCYAASPLPVASAATETPVTLSWQMWAGSQAEITAWDHDAAIVHSEFPWITVNLTYDQPFGNYFTKFPTEIASNTEPDLVAIQSLRTTGFQGGLLPLTTAELDSDGMP